MVSGVDGAAGQRCAGVRQRSRSVRRAFRRCGGRCSALYVVCFVHGSNQLCFLRSCFFARFVAGNYPEPPVWSGSSSHLVRHPEAHHTSQHSPCLFCRSTHPSSPSAPAFWHRAQRLKCSLTTPPTLHRWCESCPMERRNRWRRQTGATFRRVRVTVLPRRIVRCILFDSSPHWFALRSVGDLQQVLGCHISIVCGRMAARHSGKPTFAIRFCFMLMACFGRYTIAWERVGDVSVKRALTNAVEDDSGKQPKKKTRVKAGADFNK